MKKILILLFLGLMFAVTQAFDVGYSPDVGNEQSITYAQPVAIMPAAVFNYQFATTEVNAAVVITPASKTDPPNVTITAYHNPDYGLNFIYNLSQNIKESNRQINSILETARHVI